MAKTTAPLLSFGASGTIAKTQTYAKWRGVSYARRHVIPANPQTAEQSKTRDVFRLLSSMWLLAPALLQAPWDRNAVGQQFLGRNKFMGDNIAAMRGAADMNLFTGSPGAKGGLPQTDFTLTPGVDTLTVDFTVPAAPTGWTIAAAVAAAFPDQDPNLAFVGPIVAVEDLATPFSVVLTGLTTVGVHQVAGWLRWTKPDGSIAYGPSQTKQGTPT